MNLSARGEEFAEFWTIRRLGTLATVRADGRPHVVPVGVTVDFETGVARMITSGASVKARRIAAAGSAGTPAAVCQVDGRRWSTLEGTVVLDDDPDAVRDAEERYARRYRTPRANPQRVVLVLTVDRVLGNQ